MERSGLPRPETFRLEADTLGVATRIKLGGTRRQEAGGRRGLRGSERAEREEREERAERADRQRGSRGEAEPEDRMVNTRSGDAHHSRSTGTAPKVDVSGPKIPLSPKRAKSNNGVSLLEGAYARAKDSRTCPSSVAMCLHSRFFVYGNRGGAGVRTRVRKLTCVAVWEWQNVLSPSCVAAVAGAQKPSVRAA